MTSQPAFRPNERHNLLISPSPHLYLTSDGFVEYRPKPLTPTGARRISRSVLDRCLIRDTATDCIYAEYIISKHADELEGFLHRAWMPKGEEFPFHGLPKTVTVASKLATTGLRRIMEALGVTVEFPTSGFHAGIHALRTVSIFEFSYADGFGEFANRQRPVDLETLNAALFQSARMENRFSRSGKRLSRFENWLHNVGTPRFPENWPFVPR